MSDTSVALISVGSACLELLTMHVTWSMTLMARRVRGEADRIPAAHQKVADGAKMMMRKAAEVELAGPPVVAAAFESAQAAALAIGDALDRLLEQGGIVGDQPPPIPEEMQAFDRAMEAFTSAARTALEAD
jgi:hypothetical protein